MLASVNLSIHNAVFESVGFVLESSSFRKYYALRVGARGGGERKRAHACACVRVSVCVRARAHSWGKSAW